MDVETAASDEIEQRLLDEEAQIARLRASQMVLLREVDRRQMPTAAGCRSLGEWVAGRLDVAPETARDLVATAHRLEDLPDVEDAVGSGEIGFDRAVAIGRFAGRDDSLDLLDDLAGYDVVGIRRLAAKRRRMTRIDEECPNPRPTLARTRPATRNDHHRTADSLRTSPLPHGVGDGARAQRRAGGGNLGARIAQMRPAAGVPERSEVGWGQPESQ